MIRVTLCRGGPMCPPVLVGALYALRADTQVRPYTNHINTKNPAIRRCNTSICMDSWSCVHCVKAKRVTMRRVTLCFLSSHASKKRSFFLVSQARSTARRVNRSSGWGLPPLAAGALPERRLSFLNLPRRTLFSSGNRSAGWGLPPLAAGALPERRVSFSRLG